MAEKEPLCRTTFNQLPSFWDRRVIFISNIFSLFFGNLDQTEELRREVGSLESYGGRMLPILDLLFRKKGNLLVLEKNPETSLLDYFKTLGLSLPETAVIPEGFYEKLSEKDERIASFVERLKNHPAEFIGGYVMDEPLEGLAKSLGKKTVGSVKGSYQGNNKRLLHRFLTANNLPTFDTLEAKNAKEVAGCLETLLQKGYRFAVIKAQIGASGIGMAKIDLSQKMGPDALPAYLFFEGPVLVEGWLDKNLPSVRYIASPSIQLFVDDESCWLYDLTEQILSGQSIHQGNIAPPPFLEKHPEAKERLIAQARTAGAWLKNQGYRGTASIDFHVVLRKDAIEARICEINARVTGATYPSVLAKRLLPGHCWLMRNIRFSAPLEGSAILEKIKKDGLLFLEGNSEGVLPFNFNTDKKGQVVKGQLLFLAKTRPGVYHLLEQLSSKLSSYGGYDRD